MVAEIFRAWASGGPAKQTFATLVGLELRPRRLREAAALWERLTQAAGADDTIWRGLAAAELATLLRSMRSPTPISELQRQALDRGLTDPNGLTSLVAQLLGAGVATPCPQSRGRAASIRIHGRGPHSEPLVGSVAPLRGPHRPQQPAARHRLPRHRRPGGADRLPDRLPPTVGYSLFHFSNDSILQCFDNVTATAPDGHDAMNDPASQAFSWKITSMTPPAGPWCR
jgi:Zincin-like metallopeptidase